MDNACVRYSVIGWHSKIGQWTRVEGTPPWSINDSHETLPELDTQLIKNGQKTKTATVLGHEVTLANEIIVNNCIVLPHKTLGSSHRNDILM
ncbi:hypothetical protein HMI55_005067 [Coelomomyces lativittatus]|nr:hypothetical protein HMI55_005067 [Coelomomyces lativittatus]